MSIEERLKDHMHQAADHLNIPQDLYDSILQSTEERISDRERLTRKSRNRSIIRNAFVIGTAAVFVVIVIVSSAFISPVMAETLSRIPMMHNVFKLAGDLGLKAAEQKGLATETDYYDTHEGYTLTASQVMFDGMRGAIALQLDEAGRPASLFDPFARSQSEASSLKSKGSFEVMRAFISGTEESITWDIGPGIDAESAIVTITGAPSDQAARRPVLPETFNLTLEVRLEMIPEPFVLQIPMRKNTDNHILYPDAEKSSRDISWRLEEMERSPVSTRMELVLEETSSDERTIYFEVVGQDGTEIKIIDLFAYDVKQGYRRLDMLYEPLPADHQSFTIKPFRYVYGDSPNAWRKEYIKDLELTVPIEGKD